MTEYPSITVRRAVGIGWLRVNVPAIALLFGPTALLLLLPRSGHLGVEVWVGSALSSVVLAWLWWSVTLPLWRLWAYRRVDDVLALKHAAVEAQLAWPDGSGFGRTEIKTKSHAALERQLEEEARPVHGRYRPPAPEEESVEEEAGGLLTLLVPTAALMIGAALYERHRDAGGAAKANAGLLLIAAVCIAAPLVYRGIGVVLAGWRRALFPLSTLVGVGALLLVDSPALRTGAGRGAVLVVALVAVGGAVGAWRARR